MSFKREGDDRSQLNVLKKRRVADLLSNYIPEDEATIMSNGRYTCLVCSYGPVFDTVDMLTVHRNGKRHLEGKMGYLFNPFVLIRDNRVIEASSSAPLLAQTRKLTHHALLRTVPYNSCHRKTRLKFQLYILFYLQHKIRKTTCNAGWIQDRSGQWLKDDNVEFDSDEEEPPSLPT
uniref:Sodium channel modifier 1 n=1 Tax=Periophthalmus magnuspinnatus TaxID=409849 RepID=A0A3B4AI37_9GOBI